MFNPSRQEARQFLFEAWRKHRQGELLTPLEHMAARLIGQHPEFHELLADPERHQDRDYLPEHGEINPFLHLMMHLAIEEQLSIGQPPGIRQHLERLTQKYASEHKAQHAMMECLAEALMQAQRHHAPPDSAVYLACLERQ